PRGFDPKIHCVGNDKTRPLHLIEDMGLQLRRDVCQKDEGCSAIIWGKFGRKRLENIERDGARLTRVQVPGVFARPTKSFAIRSLNASSVDLMRLPKLEFARGKVITHYADQVHWGKEARPKSGV